MDNPPINTISQNAGIENTRRQVDEVVNIMRDNMTKVLERDVRLSELNSRADQLEASGRQFQSSSKQLHKKYYCENIKWLIALGGLAVIIIIIIIGETISFTFGSTYLYILI